MEPIKVNDLYIGRPVQLRDIGHLGKYVGSLDDEHVLFLRNNGVNDEIEIVQKRDIEVSYLSEEALFRSSHTNLRLSRRIISSESILSIEDRVQHVGSVLEIGNIAYQESRRSDESDGYIRVTQTDIGSVPFDTMGDYFNTGVNIRSNPEIGDLLFTSYLSRHNCIMEVSSIESITDPYNSNLEIKVVIGTVYDSDGYIVKSTHRFIPSLTDYRIVHSDPQLNISKGDSSIRSIRDIENHSDLIKRTFNIDITTQFSSPRISYIRSDLNSTTEDVCVDTYRMLSITPKAIYSNFPGAIGINDIEEGINNVYSSRINENYYFIGRDKDLFFDSTVILNSFRTFYRKTFRDVEDELINVYRFKVNEDESTSKRDVVWVLNNVLYFNITYQLRALLYNIGDGIENLNFFNTLGQNIDLLSRNGISIPNNSASISLLGDKFPAIKLHIEETEDLNRYLDYMLKNFYKNDSLLKNNLITRSIKKCFSAEDNLNSSYFDYLSYTEDTRRSYERMSNYGEVLHTLEGVSDQFYVYTASDDENYKKRKKKKKKREPIKSGSTVIAKKNIGKEICKGNKYSVKDIVKTTGKKILKIGNSYYESKHFKHAK